VWTQGEGLTGEWITGGDKELHGLMWSALREGSGWVRSILGWGDVKGIRACNCKKTSYLIHNSDLFCGQTACILLISSTFHLCCSHCAFVLSF